MKILMLGWELPPHNSGGLGVACYQLCKALSVQGVAIDFVVPYQDEHTEINFMNIIPALSHTAEMLTMAGGAYDSTGFGPIKNTSLDHTIAIPIGLREQQVSYLNSLRTIVKAKEYDAIHAHDWLTFEAAIMAKQFTNKPLVVHVHATEFDRSGEQHGNPIVHEIEYTTMTLADRIVAVSQATKDIIVREYGIPGDKIEVIHNSIDAADIPPLDPHNVYVYLEKMKEHGYKVVVALGRLTVQKGLTHLLRAAQLVVEHNPKMLFLLAGSGEQYHELLALSAELGIAENVVFTGGFVRGKAQRDAFAIGDMFILPSISEPFGITALEAVGYGNAVLLSKQAGVGEVLNHVLRFDYWDIYRMADQILAVAEHGTLRDELYRNSFEEFRHLSWQSVAEKCQAIYSKLIAAPKRLVL